MTAQTTPVSILLNEHHAVEAVLGYQDRALTALEDGKAVASDIFRDLTEFFTLFVGRCHHGKEEALLFPIVRRDSARAGEVTALEGEHGQGATLVLAYERAATAYAERGLDAARPLIAAGRAYAAFLRAHIERENATLQAWQRTEGDSAQDEIVAAFERYEEDVMGHGTHERLHRMIDTLGPRVAAWES